MTEIQAIEIASRYHLETEITELINSGYTPENALQEYDLL